MRCELEKGDWYDNSHRRYNTHQLLNVFSNILPQCHPRYEEINTHPSGPILLWHRDVLDGGNVEGYRATIDGQEDSFFLHVHFQLREWRGVGSRVERGWEKVRVEKRVRGEERRRRGHMESRQRMH